MEQTAQRVDRLLRSLVGVDDLRPAFDANGALRTVHILRNDLVTDHQLTRNIVSGLHAALGIRVGSSAIRIYADGAVFLTAVAALPPATGVHGPADSHQAEPDTASSNGDVAHAAPAEGDRQGVRAAAMNGNGPAHHAPRHSNGNGVHPAAVARVSLAGQGNGAVNGRATGHNGHSHAAGNGAGHTSAPLSSAARSAETAQAVPGALRLEQLGMDRHGPMLRCRVVLGSGERTFSAIAEVPDAPSAEAELAARVTLDAVRASAVACATLEGVGLTQIAHETYVVIAIRAAGRDAPRACAARLKDSVARAAAEAVLSTVASMNQPNGAATGRRSRGI
jgi:hypothetical protein